MLDNEDNELEFNDTEEDQNNAHHSNDDNHKKYLARKRIDELKEQKRLRELLDNEEDWDI